MQFNACGSVKEIFDVSANRFKVKGERVDSRDEFLRREKDGSWLNLLYYPEKFSSDSRNPIVFADKRFEDVSFKDTDFLRVSFVRCKFYRCLFASASFKDCQFVDCEFFETNTSKLRVSQCLFDPKNFDENFDLIGDTNIAIDLYHALYKNASEEHQPEHAIESLYRMKRAESAHLASRRKRGKITQWQYLTGFFGHWIYDFVSGYGFRPSRVVRLLFLVIGFFSALNFFLDAYIVGSSNSLGVIDSIYFTVVTITTLGFGDITPLTPIGRLFVTFQALLGFVVMSLFLAAVASVALRGR
ncbi:MAG: ion channel [Pseudomonadota bacterium]|nr:ion channel [Pseudomonadota bacterium]